MLASPEVGLIVPTNAMTSSGQNAVTLATATPVAAINAEAATGSSRRECRFAINPAQSVNSAVPTKVLATLAPTVLNIDCTSSSDSPSTSLASQINNEQVPPHERQQREGRCRVATIDERMPSFAEAFRVWLRIGLLSFGGPAAQIALLHREVVTSIWPRWRWPRSLPSACFG